MPSRLIDENGELITPKRVNKSRPRSRKPRARSARYYLAKMEVIIAHVEAGLLTASEGQKRIAMQQTAMDTFLSVKALDDAGIGGPLDTTPEMESTPAASIIRDDMESQDREALTIDLEPEHAEAHGNIKAIEPPK